MRTILISTALLNGTQTLAHEYRVSIDDDLERLEVEARFDTKVTSVRARSQSADRYVHDIRDCETNDRLRTNGRRLQLPDDGIRCLRYEVDLLDAARDERRNSALVDSNVVVSPAAWFWRPPLRGDDEITVRFTNTDSINVSVPWLPVDGEPNTYRLTASPESARAPAVFGDFDYVERDIDGATLRITLLKPYGRLGRDSIVDWVVQTAGSINLAADRFPNPSPTVVVVPVGRSSWSDSPVPFGRVIRDGGETIELFINQDRPIGDFYDDWTATHEFSHLMLPYVRSRHRWVSEGFATYYQNVLLARAGQYTQQRAWQRLYEGFERGRGSRPEMSPNDAASKRRGTMKIYWSGAAIALMADVELRRRSNGEQTLDSVLRELASCCLPSERSWSGPELFETLDRYVDEPLFMPLYRRYANSPGFPDYRATFDELGVRVSNGRVALEDRGTGAALRKSITGVPAGR
ncbi:MAG: hypothetical protein QNJ00_07875 [Woeseiaceae bacterium]|nr:hypothetical protein [Woeseiaceae bacterium]